MKKHKFLFLFITSCSGIAQDKIDHTVPQDSGITDAAKDAHCNGFVLNQWVQHDGGLSLVSICYK